MLPAPFLDASTRSTMSGAAGISWASGVGVCSMSLIIVIKSRSTFVRSDVGVRRIIFLFSASIRLIGWKRPFAYDIAIAAWRNLPLSLSSSLCSICLARMFSLIDAVIFCNFSSGSFMVLAIPSNIQPRISLIGLHLPSFSSFDMEIP